MGRETRLDALLGVRLRGEGHGAATLPEDDDDVVAALAAADHLLGLRLAEPGENFARDLETRLLAHAQALATVVPPLPQMANRRGSLRRSPTTYTAAGRRASHHAKVLWPLIAASLALVIAVGTLTVVAAAARPGSPLYALHRWEQGVQVQLAQTAADKVRLHLANARSALASLNAAVAQRQGDPAYSDALATLQSEDHAAATTLQTLPPGSERDTLTAQLDALHQAERPDLYAALSVISWPDQLATTHALGSLGAAIPQVSTVTLRQLAPGDSRGWRVTISGVGFEPGAQLVGSSGAIVGQVMVSGPTQLTVDITDSERHLLDKGVGVRNPDGTAAVLPAPTETGPGQGSSGGPQGTPLPGSGGSHGGGHQPTPSPSVPRGR